MASIEPVQEKTDYEQFGTTASFFSGGAFLQAFEWGEFLQATGKRVERVLLRDKNGRLRGRAMLIWEKRGPGLKFAYCPFGPELDWENLAAAEIEEIFRSFREFLRARGAVFWRFNPPLLANFSLQSADLRESAAKTVQPKETLFLDLTQTPEELLAQMKSKTRYNIRLAQKKGLEVKTDGNSENFKAFWQLAQETGQRNDFALHSKQYYRVMLETLAKTEQIKLFVAHWQGQAVAAILVIFDNKTATYLHGASANQHRNLMAPYLLQWTAIQEARERGFKYYDFWGVDEQKWPGVTRFKLGFGGQRAAFKPTYEQAIRKLPFWFFRLAQKMRA